MDTIETIAPIGPDGVLRLEVPVSEKNRDVDVTVVVRPLDTSLPQKGGSAGLRGGNGASIRLPSPGAWNQETVVPLDLGTSGLSAAEMLVRDRR
jgi:hypothetical protein